MSATTVNDSMYQGDAASITIPVINNAGQPVDLTGASATYVIETAMGGTTKITKTIGSGITVTNASGGIMTMKLSSTDTTGLTPATYYHQLSITDSSSDTLISFTGDLTINAKG